MCLETSITIDTLQLKRSVDSTMITAYDPCYQFEQSFATNKNDQSRKERFSTFLNDFDRF